MATKRPALPASPAPRPRARAPAAPPCKEVRRVASRTPLLTVTETPGIYLNRLGVKCDVDGIALSFKQIRAMDADVVQELGNSPDTLDPLLFMNSVMSNPTVSMTMRMDAAKAIAGYTVRKPTQGVDGGLGPDGKPLPLFSVDMALIKELTEVELVIALKVLRVLNVPITDSSDTDSRDRALSLLGVEGD